MIGSLWPVFAASTAILMTIFFEQWRKAGWSAPEALYKAQIIVRDAQFNTQAKSYFKDSLPESIGTIPLAAAYDVLHKELYLDDFDHPFYWVAFIIFWIVKFSENVSPIQARPETYKIPITWSHNTKLIGSFT